MSDAKPSADEVRARLAAELEHNPEPPPPELVVAETDLAAYQVCAALGVHHAEGLVAGGRAIGRCQRCGLGLVVTP